MIPISTAGKIQMICDLTRIEDDEGNPMDPLLTKKDIEKILSLTTHELWIHKEQNIMCEHFLKRTAPTRRTVQFSYQQIGRDLSDIQIGAEDNFLGAHYVLMTNYDAVIFPDEFIKVGDV